MGSALMTDTGSRMRSAQRARKRALIIPREHGAWGLLLVPLSTGVAVGAASARQVWPLVLFTIVALALFWLRTPVESLLGTTPLSAQTAAERRIALIASGALGLISVGCLTGLLWGGHNRALFLFGSIGPVAFMAQTLLMKKGRELRMIAQMVGAVGLTCTAPAAYYVATGRLDERAWMLWAANWIFSVNQIHFVQLRIHAARAATFEEKCARGWWFFVGQVLLMMIVIGAVYLRVVPVLVSLAFVPALARGFYWFFCGVQPLQVKSLGWSEMRQGVVFGVLVAVASIIA
jgi:hypothetical protein